MVAGILLSWKKPTQWFSWFGLWTAKKWQTTSSNVYTPKTVQNDTVLDVISAHTKLFAANTYFAPVGDMVWISSIPQYLAASQRLLMIDIIAYLENASDKEASVDTLLAQMNFYVDQWWLIKNQLSEIIQKQAMENEACTSSKEQGDRDFYQWLRDGEAVTMIQWLENSKKYAACQATSRVDINAHTIMQGRVNDITAAMASIIVILTQNRQTIISNFMLFKDNNLERLILVRDQLRRVSPGTN